ncbi:hypothetical protein [Streptomyces sp. NPDC014744]|uniref:hypothetical protein n=1 Tax=Streptomyces sp. NPDC014744 TaxID=3364903 RepID=UPI0036FBAD52
MAQMVTVVARRAEQIEPDRDGDASCPLHEAAALITDNAEMRLIWAARALRSLRMTELLPADAREQPGGPHRPLRRREDDDREHLARLAGPVPDALRETVSDDFSVKSSV